MLVKFAVTVSTGQLGRLAMELLKERELADQVIALTLTTDNAATLGVE